MKGYEHSLGELEDDYENENSEEETETANFVCEDCDYRWEDTYIGEDWEDKGVICPMCGSVNITRL